MSIASILRCHYCEFLLVSLCLCFAQKAHAIQCPDGEVPALPDGLLGAPGQTPSDEYCVPLGNQPILVDPNDFKPPPKEDDSYIHIELADETDASLDIGNTFFMVDIPRGQSLYLFAQPSIKAQKNSSLKAGTDQVKIKKFGKVKGLTWAYVCKNQQCGWTQPHTLRETGKVNRGNNTSQRNQGRLIEAAFPQVNVFSDPSVQSRQIGALYQGQRVYMLETRSGRDGEAWAKVCADNWCGWVAPEFFEQVQ